MIALVFLITTAFAQNFELVDEEEYKEYYKKPIYVPDVRFSGSYQLYNLNIADVSGDRTFSWQDFELGLKSEVHEKISLNLIFSSRPYDLERNGDNYQSYDLEERQNRNRDNIGVSLSEFFLEYNFNPTSIFRVGRQTINLGDKRGLIYKGEVDAFVFSCRIGTWCLEFGQANLGQSANRVTWLGFDYPIYQSVETIENYWLENDTKKRLADSLKVEFYRIDDHQERLALAKYGGRTFNPYQDSSNQTVTSEEQFYYEDNAVFFNREFNTLGINLDWYNNNFGLLLNFITTSGNKKYFFEDDNSVVENITSVDRSGNIYRLEWQQLAGNSSQFGITGFFSSAKAAGDTESDNLPWRGGFEYYEWNRGTYGDALIYFNQDYRGESHSVGNLSYTSFYYKYYGYDNNFGVTTEIFIFNRVEPVLASNGEKVSDIGYEWDINLFLYLEKSLKVELSLGYFSPGVAYSPKESEAPSGTIVEAVTRYVTGLSYQF